jgi:rubrerythrin
MTRRTAGVSGIVAAICMGLASVVVAAEGSATLANLQAAYSGELSAKVRYEAFGITANTEGYKSVAVLFRAAADSADIHARNIAGKITKMGAEPMVTASPLVIKSTRENLEACLKGNTSADESMYPKFITQAEADKDAAAAMTFKGAHVAEVEQGKFFKAALDKLDGWKDLGKEFAVCQVCGYIVMGPAPAACPVCSAPKDKFRLFSK